MPTNLQIPFHLTVRRLQPHARPRRATGVRRARIAPHCLCSRARPLVRHSRRASSRPEIVPKAHPSFDIRALRHWRCQAYALSRLLWYLKFSLRLHPSGKEAGSSPIKNDTTPSRADPCQSPSLELARRCQPRACRRCASSCCVDLVARAHRPVARANRLPVGAHVAPHPSTSVKPK